MKKVWLAPFIITFLYSLTKLPLKNYRLVKKSDLPVEKIIMMLNTPALKRILISYLKDSERIIENILEIKSPNSKLQSGVGAITTLKTYKEDIKNLKKLPLLPIEAKMDIDLVLDKIETWLTYLLNNVVGLN